MDDPQEVVAWGPIDGEPPVGLDVRAEHPTMVDAFDKAAVHYCVTSGCGIIQDPDFARGGNNMRIICPDKNCCLAFHYTRRTRGNCKKRAVRAGQHAEYSAGGGSNTSWGKAKGFFEEFKAQNPSCKVEVEFDKNGRCNWAFAMVDGPTAELLENASLRVASADGTAMKGDSPDDGNILVLEAKLADGRIWPIAIEQVPVSAYVGSSKNLKDLKAARILVEVLLAP
ncbi:hypothetical protein T484DRAFT_1895647 [Baffinella frigidus]|nr:hypothetical protein T484DRAFT_1895647 [Cryptophyta sp. CCMP2293]